MPSGAQLDLWQIGNTPPNGTPDVRRSGSRNAQIVITRWYLDPESGYTLRSARRAGRTPGGTRKPMIQRLFLNPKHGFGRRDGRVNSRFRAPGPRFRRLPSLAACTTELRKGTAGSKLASRSGHQ